MVLWWHFLQDVIENLQFYGRCCQWRVTREIQGMRLLLTWPLMRYKSQKASLCSIPGMLLAMAPFDASPDGHSRTIFIFAPDHSLDKCFSQTTGNFRSIFVVKVAELSRGDIYLSFSANGMILNVKIILPLIWLTVTLLLLTVQNVRFYSMGKHKNSSRNVWHAIIVWYL